MAKSRTLAFLRAYPQYLAIWKRWSSLTMAPRRRYFDNLFLVQQTLRNPALTDGAIVECGTWKGGMSCGLLEVGGDTRTFHFFDSFEGLPTAGDLDGPEAQPGHAAILHDNNTADFAAFEAATNRARRPGQKVFIHKGWFQDTVSTFPGDQPIAVLRLDGDWYESTMVCLEGLFDKVLPGGIIIIDDYYDWDGCAQAVHDFLSARKATDRLHVMSAGGVVSRPYAQAYIIKRPAEVTGGPS